MLVKWRGFVASAICATALLLFVGVQALELGEYYGSQQIRMQQANIRLDKLQALQEQHPDLEAYQMEVENQRKHVDELLPDRLEVAALLPRLQQCALKSGLELRELLPGEAVKEQGMRALPLQIRVAGDYFGLLDFVKSLEKGTPFCRIKAMEMEQKDNTLEVMLQANVYSL